MNPVDFSEVVEVQFERCSRVLSVKSDEYSTEGDKLHNFKVAADLQGCTQREALGGMMAKHTVSIYDMIHSDSEYVMDIWDEKITDHINYLLLLKAILEEEHRG